MPFAKRVVEPQLLCRHSIPNNDALLFEDLCSISNVALSRTLRQLSDLAKHACSIFQELENDLMSTNHRVRGLQNKINQLQQFTSELDPKQEAVPVSNLDVETKLTTHYQAPWHQQANVFHPSTRPPCVEELHRHAKLSLRAMQKDPQQRRAGLRERRVTIAISVAPPMPSYPSPRTLRKRDSNRESNLRTFETTRSSSPTECCHFSPWSRKAVSPDPDTDLVALGHRSKYPVPNTPTTLDKQTNWSKALPLPTPEERMKSNSQVITSCVIPINVTGVGFDRDASVRCSLVHSQSVLQRRRKLRRRKTVAGIPRQVQQDLDSDESPSSRERTVIVHARPDSEDLGSHLSTRDSGCQTEDFLTSGAPSRRRVRAQRGQGVSLALSYSAGNIASLPDSGDIMFAASAGARLRSRSLPRDGRHLVSEVRNHSDGEEDEEEEELSPFETEDFLSGPQELSLKGGGESTDEQTGADHQLGILAYEERAGSPGRDWMERGQSRLPRKTDLGSCEISSSSDTFSSPVHSVSAAGVLGSQMDHKDDHQSSSGNWSGSSSTCPSQTSETIPLAASPPLTGSSHCDSELSLNAAAHIAEDSTSFLLDCYHMERLQGLRTQRAGSFSSTAMDILEDAGVGAASDGEWSYPIPEPPCAQDFNPEQGREAEGSLGCPSFTSMATYESSYSDKPPSEKADTVSHYSVDTEGYYTSMHFDCGLKGSKSFTYNYASTVSDSSQLDFSGHMTLGHERRCLSLRKPKVKPCPPKRSSSLRKIYSEGNIADKKEPKITCGQKLPSSSKDGKLQLDLVGSLDCVENPLLVGGPLEAWGVQGSVELSDLGAFSSTDTHSFKDEGAVQSDYADLWLLNDLKSNDTYRSLSNSSTATGTTVIECIKTQESSESQSPDSRATTPSLPSVEGEFRLASPEKLASLASPSSGYSSQSETPTSSLPLAFFPNPLSPSSGKRKPKVPERKSSLSSLQSLPSRDGGSSSRRDLELPIIPPSHLDLSALLNVGSKPSAYKNQIQNKQRTVVPIAGKPVALSNPEAPCAHPITITPKVLHSVQLRSICKDNEGTHKKTIADAATRPKCPTVNVGSTHSSSRSLDFTSVPPVYNSHHHTSVQGSFESLLTPNDGPPDVSREIPSHSDVKNKQEKQVPAPLGSTTAFRLQSEQSAHRGTDAIKLPMCPDVELSTEPSPPCPGGGSVAPEPLQLTAPREESSSLINRSSSFNQHSSAQNSEMLDKLPLSSYQSETSQACTITENGSKEVEFESLCVPPRSASCDSTGDSTANTEDYLSKESTPSDSVMNEETRPEDDNVFLSPSKTRTTEDLFAMIHRSKRKVLGRKDSTELNMRNRLGAASGNASSGSPVTPPSPVVSPAGSPASPATSPGLHKVPGPIYRNAKKSSTSNEEFKLLLLKKGSRSDSSYRMSATEILKSPVTPKSPGDPLTEGPRQAEEPLSPLQQQSASASDQLTSGFPKANAEGFSPKAYPSPAASRQGRSRIPPPANSSRYGIRSRLYTAPMQAISEGETENSDGSPHDDRSS